MLLRNTREPYDIVEHDNEDRITFMLERGYVYLLEVDRAYHAPVAEVFGELRGKRGKKADQPPATLSDSALADELSKDGE